MNQDDAPRSRAERDQQIDVALAFTSAVQHLGEYHRLGLSFDDALSEALVTDVGKRVHAVDGDGYGEPRRGPSEQATTRILNEQTVDVLKSMEAWSIRMAHVYNDDSPWPHPLPAAGW